MSVLTEFVIADRVDAQRVCDAMSPCVDFPGLDYGVDVLKLSALYAVLTGTEFDATFVGGDLLATGGEEGPWVLAVPEALTDRLANLDEKELASLAAKWMETQEFSPDERRAEPVHGFLNEFVRLCKQAAAARKSVLMWTAL